MTDEQILDVIGRYVTGRLSDRRRARQDGRLMKADGRANFGTHLVDVTERQVYYWAAAGALGQDKRDVGIGHYRQWTAHEFDKLNAIGRVSKDLRALGLGGIPSELVAKLWTRLDSQPPAHAHITCGSITICVRLRRDR